MVTNIQAVLFGFTIACVVYFMIMKNNDDDDHFGYT